MRPGYTDLTTLWRGQCNRMFFATLEEAYISSLTAFKFDQTLFATSMAYEFDLSKELWLTKGRFTGLQRDYISKAALDEFIEKSSQVSTKRPQASQMQCRMKGQRHVSYKWGNCILAFTFRRLPIPQLTMHSRTTMITRMGGMDLALAYHVAKLIAAASDENHEDYAFMWHVGSLQHSSLQGVPYFLSHRYMYQNGELRPAIATLVNKYGLDNLPVMRAMIRQLDYFDRLDAEGKVSKLGTRRRVREQRRAWVEGKMHRRAVPLDTLSLGQLKEDS